MTDWLAGQGAAPALIDVDGRTLTYAELAAEMAAVRRGAAALGITATDRVAIIAQPDLATVVAILGLLSCASVVPIAPGMTDEVRRRALDRAAPVRLLTSAAELTTAAADGNRVPGDETGLGPEHVALLLPTSGTTSAARLVPLTNRMLAHGAAAVASSLRLGPQDRGLHTLPLQHVGGIVDLLLAPLSRGGCVRLAGPFDASRVWSLLPESTWWQAAPAMLAALLDAEPYPRPDLTRVRLVRSVSAPLPTPLRDRVEAALAVPVVEIYGMTETAGVICSQPLDDRRTGSVGRPVALELRLVDDDGSSGSAGEVQVRGRQVLAGYAGGPGVPLDRSSFAADWLRTGDIGRLDADGHLYLVGRVKDLINHGGEKVAPADVDEILMTHPAIVDAAAFGLPHPTLGEVVAAVVVLRPEVVVDLAALQEHVSASLPRSHAPRRAAVVAEIPRRNGKLSRADLPALLEVSVPLTADAAVGPASTDRRGLDAVDPAAVRVRTWLGRAWARALDVAEATTLDADADFFAAGGDSLRAAAIVAEVGEVAGELVYVTSVYQAPTIGRYERLLAAEYPVTWSALAGKGTAAERIDRPLDDVARNAFAAGFASGVGRGAGMAGPDPLARLGLIVSAPRSGSTLLRAMLAGHPQLFVPPELYLLPFATMRARQAAFPGGLASQREGLERAWVGATGCTVEEARSWVRDLEDEDVPTIEVYRRLADAVPGRLLVDKTPMNNLRAPWLEGALAAVRELHVVHLVRHPAGMAESFAEARLGALWWPRLTGSDREPVPGALSGENEASFGELLWCAIEDVVDAVRLGVPTDRWTDIRFEDLVSDPSAQAQQACAALGVSWSDDIAARVLDPYGDARERMTDGLHERSRMIGDPKFAGHGRIEPLRGRRGERSGRALAPGTRERAGQRGYAAPSVSVTAAQERLWRLARLSPDRAPHVVPLAYRLEGDLDVGRLEGALTAVVARHDALRTTFPAGSDAAAAPIVHPARPVVIPVVDVRWIRWQNSTEVADAELARQVRAEVGRPFDVANGPLWRARLFQVEPREALLVLSFHRLVFDGPSRAVFEADLARAFSGERLDVAPEWSAVASALTARARARADADATAWSASLDGLAAPTALPTDHERPPGPAEAVGVRRPLPEPLVGDLARRAAGGGPTIAAGWLAATAIALYRRTGQHDLVLQVPTAGRSVPLARDALGGWTTLVPARIGVAPQEPRSAIVARAQEALALALDHDGLPREEIVGRHPLAAGPVVVSVQHRREEPLTLSGLAVRAYPVRRPAADADLAIHLELGPGGAVAAVDAHGGLFRADTAVALLDEIVEELAACLRAPADAVGPSPAATPDDVVTALRAVPGVDDAAAFLDPATGRTGAAVVLDEDAPAHRPDLLAAARLVLPAYRVPAPLRAVDALPLRADGVVDVERLIDLVRAGDGHKEGTGPADDLEALIARTWQEVLWRDTAVDVNTAFRDYGGHSLLAVQLVVELEQRLGRPLPPRALAHLDTIAGLARALRSGTDSSQIGSEMDTGLPREILAGLLAHTATWEGDRQRPEAVIVGRNVGGSRVPLFWCLQNEREHRALSDALGPDRPMFAMRSGNRVMVKSDENIDLLADYYVREIREIRPEGPYLLGGNCQAARIALRVARRLRAEGAEVPVLLMMEKFDPIEYDGPVAMLFGDRSDRNPFSHFSDPGRGYLAWYSGPLWLRHIQGPHGQFFTPENVPVLAARVAEHLDYAVGGGPPPPGRVVGPAPAVRLGEDAYRATITLVPPGRGELAPGGPADVDVLVRNTGREPWPPSPQSALGIAARWRMSDGAPAAVATVAPLPQSVEPGQEIRVSLSFRAPAEPGRWTLEVDVVDEGVAWFSERGSTPARTEVLVGERVWRRLRPRGRR